MQNMHIEIFHRVLFIIFTYEKFFEVLPLFSPGVLGLCPI